MDFDLEHNLESDFDLEQPLTEEDDNDEAPSSWWAEFPFRGFSAMWWGRFLTASDMATSAPLATVGRGRRGSRFGSDSGSGSGSGEDGSASAWTLHKREMQTTMKYINMQNGNTVLGSPSGKKFDIALWLDNCPPQSREFKSHPCYVHVHPISPKRFMYIHVPVWQHGLRNMDSHISAIVITRKLTYCCSFCCTGST